MVTNKEHRKNRQATLFSLVLHLTLGDRSAIAIVSSFPKLLVSFWKGRDEIGQWKGGRRRLCGLQGLGDVSQSRRIIGCHGLHFYAKHEHLKRFDSHAKVRFFD
mmetsp:Transcript_8911/g.21763  ORF Transcript_8911/g.21763 Transcript_8911/m.21763 type:complete len:104 (-) Transcript_8911:204-515(-)